jgi:hypothetical protein
MRVTESSYEFHVLLAISELVSELHHVSTVFDRIKAFGLLLILWRLNQGFNVSRLDKGDVSGRGPIQTPGSLPPLGNSFWKAPYLLFAQRAYQHRHRQLCV